MNKAFTDIMYIGAGGKCLVIAYLLTSVLTGLICISYFAYRWLKEKQEHEEYMKILKELGNEESTRND